MNYIKRLGKSFLTSRLERQVLRLRAKYPLKVIAVAGSVGKTSTKTAIAELLVTCGEKVQYQKGNYNDRLTVPLIFFGETEPAIFDIKAWLGILRRAKKTVKAGYSYQTVVVELGPDGPGQMQHFAYLKPDIAVLTAISPEHMEFFKTMDAVAAEELQVKNYAKQLLINVDDTDAKYLQDISYLGYGLTGTDFSVTVGVADKPTFHLRQQQPFVAAVQYLGTQGAKVALAAAAVAELSGHGPEQITTGLKQLQPVAGRMQVLSGAQGSMLIDDTYNASPIAVEAALDVLYAQPQKQRIAILGSMNELGDSSQAAHEQIGAYCDPTKLDAMYTVGKVANQYLAPAAEAKGCKVVRCDSPVQAGQQVAKLLTSNTVVLAKGSQNGVFTEEALKLLLANPADASKLVRQSASWMTTKRHQFPDIAS